MTGFQTVGGAGEPVSALRLLPTGTLPVRLVAPGSEAVWGTLAEMGVHGLCVGLPAAALPRLALGTVVEVRAGAREQVEFTAPARVTGTRLVDQHAARCELEFIPVAGQSTELERFFFAHFERRSQVRAAPLARDVVRAQLHWPGGQLTARVHDLSAGGMALSISPLSVVQLQTGQELGLRFRLPAAVRSIAGKGEVRYTAELPRYRLIGIAFDLGDPQGIARERAEIDAFVAENAARARAWQQGWQARGA
jgi:hypothetical protein